MSSSMDKQGGMPLRSPGYETSDANVRGIVKLLGYLALLLVATGIVCLFMFRHFLVSEADSSNPSPFVGTRQVPSGPQLQVNPRQDLLHYQDQQQRSLESYSWEDRGAGKVRMPIERAMSVLAEKGLPVASTATVAPKGESSKAKAPPSAKSAPKVDVKK